MQPIYEEIKSSTALFGQLKDTAALHAYHRAQKEALVKQDASPDEKALATLWLAKAERHLGLDGAAALLTDVASSSSLTLHVPLFFSFLQDNVT